MTGITLSILPEKPERIYESGETIKGQVNVVVEREFPEAALLLVLYCQGFSESKRFTATIEKEKGERNLFKGPWTTGTYAYPFEIVAPAGPFTYKGHVFDVTWHLGARVRASGGEDARVKEEIAIVPGKKASERIVTKASGEIVYKESPKSLKGFLVFSVVLFLAGLVIGWRNSPFSEGTDTGIFFFGGVLPMVLGLALLFFTTWQALVNKRIKKAEVRLGVRQASPGEKIPCALTFQANLPFEIDRVSVVLRGEEVVDFRSPSRGGGGKLCKHLLYENLQELPLAVKQVPAHVPVQAEGEVLVPAGIPYSIDLTESEKGMALTWQLEFRIEMKKWPDWMHLETITVQP